MTSPLNRRLSELSPEKRTLLELWLQNDGAKKDSAAASDRQQVPRRDPSQHCPLSFGQRPSTSTPFPSRTASIASSQP